MFTVALQGEGIGQPLAVATSGDRLIQVFGIERRTDRSVRAVRGRRRDAWSCPSAPVVVGGQAFTSALRPDYLVTEGYAASAMGPVRIRAAAPTSSADISFGAMRTALWWVVPGARRDDRGLTWLLVGRSLRPVAALTRRVAEISASTLHERVPEPASRDEVGRLARTMNGMLDRLDASARRQREFVADASHELRSPLASIRTQVEVASMPSADVASTELTIRCPGGDRPPRCDRRGSPDAGAAGGRRGNGGGAAAAPRRDRDRRSRSGATSARRSCVSPTPTSSWRAIRTACAAPSATSSTTPPGTPTSG